MEPQMQNSRFVVLTGHLNDYPLSDLVGILRHQHKTGRLLIEYPKGPASFYFNNGELVDAQLDKLSGLQALCVALAQPPSSFNFNPLIRPTRRSIENSLQRAVSELVGCWSENDAETYELPAPSRTPAALPSASSATVEAPVVKPDALVMSAFAAAPPARRFSHPFFAMGAVGLLLLGLSTVITVTGGLGKNLPTIAVSTSPANDRVALPGGNNLPSPESIETETKNEPRVGRATSKGAHAGRVMDQPARQANHNASDSKDADSSDSTSTASPSSAKPAQELRVETDPQSVKVVLQIEGGRVAKASIANHRSGMEAYEAMALRIAKQRRYPTSGSNQETVTIKVSQPK